MPAIEALPDSSREEEPASAIHDGGRDAFVRMMRDNNQRLYRIVRAMVPSDHEAEDIVQETYVRAFRAFADFRGEASTATWLTRIAMNETRDRQRRRRSTVLLDEVTNVLPMEVDRTMNETELRRNDPEAATARAEIRRYLERAINDLPEGLRGVFALRAFEERSTLEVADILDLKPETVKTRYHRAKAMLRDVIDAEIHSALDEAFPFGGTRCNRMVALVLDRLARN